jgi:flagellar hook-associated protein 3 FlgL
MYTRTTSEVQISQIQLELQQQYNSLASLNEEAASGKRINQASDDPIGIVTALADTAQDGRYTTYLSNISAATTTLNTSTSALDSVSSLLTQARTIATEGANGQITSGSSVALAQQVTGLINQALSLANTQNNGSYIFGGTATNKTPFSVATTNAAGEPETIAYNGSQDRGQTLIGPGQTVDTEYSGSQVFQTSGQDVFKALIGLRDDLENSAGLSSSQQSQALSQDIQTITDAQNGVLATVAEQGTDTQNLQAQQNQLEQAQTTNKQDLSNVQDADITNVISQLQSQQNAYQLTLEVASQIFSSNNSLLSFIK